jgi:hypothetical protein
LLDSDITADFKVNSFDPMIPYLVEFRYKQIYGNNGMMLAGQNNENTLIKTQLESLPNYPDWIDFSAYYEPVKTLSVMKVCLSSPLTKDALGTRVFYDNLSVYKVFTNELFLIQHNNATTPTKPRITFEKISPTLYKGTVDDAYKPHVITFSENYSPDWAFEIPNIKEAQIEHFSADLYKNAWYIETENSQNSYGFIIQYKPQKLFYKGMTITILTIISCLVILIFPFVKKKLDKVKNKE